MSFFPLSNPNNPILSSSIRAYRRASTENKQNPRESFERQLLNINTVFCHNYDLSQMPIFSDTESGRNIQREAYQRMLADARRKQLKLILVDHTDRFGRNVVEALRAIDELDAIGVAVRFSTMPNIDPASADGRPLVVLIFAMAKRESMILAARVSGAMLVRLMNGKFNGKVPDGYRNVQYPQENGRVRKSIEINPERAPVIRLMFDLMLQDKPLNAISEILHEKGFLRADGQPFVSSNPKKKYRNSVSTVWQVLKNPTYAGWVRSQRHGIQSGEIRGKWEAMIEDWQFEAVQAKLAKRHRGNGGIQIHFYLLQALVYWKTDEKLLFMECETSSVKRLGGKSYYSLGKPYSVYIPGVFSLKSPSKSSKSIHFRA